LGGGQTKNKLKYVVNVRINMKYTGYVCYLSIFKFSMPY
jgi:hypothetical protein